MPTANRQPTAPRTSRIGSVVRVVLIVIALAITAVFVDDRIRGQHIASAPSVDAPSASVTAQPEASAFLRPTPVQPAPVAHAKPTKFAGPPYKGVAGGVTIEIPRLGITAPIVPIGLTPTGEIASPEGPDVVGWYNLSPPPGSPGNSVLAGHVDWKTQTAVFWQLRTLVAGDVIIIASDETGDSRYVVEWVKSYRFDDAPIETVFASLYEPALTIITCEGVFDPITHNYSKRLVVRAKAE